MDFGTNRCSRCVYSVPRDEGPSYHVQYQMYEMYCSVHDLFVDDVAEDKGMRCERFADREKAEEERIVNRGW